MGAQAAVLDIAAAYRTVPCLPDHKRFLVCTIGRSFYMDHAVPFGVASAHYLLGEVADAMLDIISASQKEQACALAEMKRIQAEVSDGKGSVRSLQWRGGDGFVTSPRRDGGAAAPNPLPVIDWAHLG